MKEAERAPSPDRWGGIAVFIPSLDGGGAEKVAIRLGAEFASRGIPVDLVVGSSDGPRLAQVPDAVNLVDLGVSRFRYALPGLIRYLRRRRPGVMLSFLVQANLLAILARLASRYPKRLVVSERLHPSAASITSDLGWFKLMPTLIRFFYPLADRVVAVSQGVADDLVEDVGLPQRLVIAIPNPVEADEIRKLSQEEIDHPWLTDAITEPIVLGVGRLAPSKDFGTLVRAVSLMETNCRLIIIGEGPDRNLLTRLCEALGVECDLPGYVSNPYAWMRSCDVIALSSRVEGFPNVLIEALALGKPIVATDCPSGPAEILENGRLGRLTPVGDAGAMATAILGAISEPMKPDTLKARTTAWTMESIASRYLEVVKGATCANEANDAM